MQHFYAFSLLSQYWESLLAWSYQFSFLINYAEVSQFTVFTAAVIDSLLYWWEYFVHNPFLNINLVKSCTTQSKPQTMSQKYNKILYKHHNNLAETLTRCFGYWWSTGLKWAFLACLYDNVIGQVSHLFPFSCYYGVCARHVALCLLTKKNWFQKIKDQELYFPSRSRHPDYFCGPGKENQYTWFISFIDFPLTSRFINASGIDCHIYDSIRMCLWCFLSIAF